MQTKMDYPKYVVWEQVALAKGAYRVQKVKEIAFLTEADWLAVDGDQFEDELTVALALLGRAYIGGWVGMECLLGGAVTNMSAHLA